MVVVLVVRPSVRAGAAAAPRPPCLVGRVASPAFLSMGV